MKKVLILLVFFCLCFSSCRTRKIDEKKKEEKTEVQTSEVSKLVVGVDSMVQKNIEKNTQKDTEESSDKYKLMPQNPNLPIDIVDSKGRKTSIYNASVELEKNVKKDKTKEAIKDNSCVKSTSHKESTLAANSKQISTKKDLDYHKKVEPSMVLMLFPYFISLLILIIIYLIWRYRKKIPYFRNFFS